MNEFFMPTSIKEIEKHYIPISLDYVRLACRILKKLPCQLNGSNIRIRLLQNVFHVGHFLIFSGEICCCCCCRD